ncbi:hypothetical protein E2C01_021987 [Portunus trituberculatus]|uniref:Uncharacterized protein n=1 Tax=Portunus trituberculatus TaxID=210409 RepID=A0A5B7E6D7_PORTR|nr:hypothetical protein [Portunus trituberculatus]
MLKHSCPLPTSLYPSPSPCISSTLTPALKDGGNVAIRSPVVYKRRNLLLHFLLDTNGYAGGAADDTSFVSLNCSSRPDQWSSINTAIAAENTTTTTTILNPFFINKLLRSVRPSHSNIAISSTDITCCNCDIPPVFRLLACLAADTPQQHFPYPDATPTTQLHALHCEKELLFSRIGPPPLPPSHPSTCSSKLEGLWGIVFFFWVGAKGGEIWQSGKQSKDVFYPEGLRPPPAPPPPTPLGH